MAHWSCDPIQQRTIARVASERWHSIGRNLNARTRRPPATRTEPRRVTAFTRFREALGDRVVREHDSRLEARCPAHDDQNPSLGVSTGDDGRVLAFCQAGCSLAEIIGAVGLTIGDLFEASTPHARFGQRPAIGQRMQIKTMGFDGIVEALYDYCDADGRVLYTKVRAYPKQFLMGCERDGGKWRVGTDNRPAILYRLPDVARAIAERSPVVIVEGEKDVDRLAALGIVASCNRDGAAKDSQRAKWKSSDSAQLAGVTEVVIMPDNDDAGRAHARFVAKSLSTRTPTPVVRILALPGLPPKGDVSDWLDAGGTREELRSLMASAPTASECGAPPAADDEEPDETRAAGADITEDGLASLFTIRYGERLLFCGGLGGWHEYDGTRWHRDTTLLAFDNARAIAREVAQKLSAKQCAIIKAARTISAIERLARADRVHARDAEEFDADPWLLNTPGGAVDLRTGNLRESRAADLCTSAASIAPGGEAPRFRQFLHEVTGGDAELIAYLHRLIGYTLTGDTREHALIFLHGKGGNGKSVLLNLLLWIMGDYAKTAPMTLFTEQKNEGHPTEQAGLRGARLVVANETEEGRRWAESRIKSMTGGDPITARFMRGDFFTFVPQFKVIIAGNHRPRFRNPDEAIRRRLHLVPFLQQFPNPDRELAEKLRVEAPGILAWAINGCQQWQEMGLQPPASVRVATSDYLEAEDVIGAWLDECTVDDVNAHASSSDLFASWSAWAQSHGEFVGSQRYLSEKLLTRGVKDGRTKSRRGFVGLRLLPVTQMTDPLLIDVPRAHTRAGAHAPGQRAYAEVMSSASPQDCATCDDMRTRYKRPKMQCAECRSSTTGSRTL